MHTDIYHLPESRAFLSVRCSDLTPPVSLSLSVSVSAWCCRRAALPEAQGPRVASESQQTRCTIGGTVSPSSSPIPKMWRGGRWRKEAGSSAAAAASSPVLMRARGGSCSSIGCSSSHLLQLLPPITDLVPVQLGHDFEPFFIA